MWGLVLKLLVRVFSWHPWNPGTLKLDSRLTLFQVWSVFLPYLIFQDAPWTGRKYVVVGWIGVLEATESFGHSLHIRVILDKVFREVESLQLGEVLVGGAQQMRQNNRYVELETVLTPTLDLKTEINVNLI